MKKAQLFVCVIFATLLAHSQQKHTVTYPDGKIHFEYHTKHGMLDGPFISYYENGNKKAEGKYGVNQRRGNWKVWDSRGLRRAERVYENSFDYRTTGLWDSAGNKCKVRQKVNNKFSTIDPAFGYVPYYPITEKEVLWCKRMWREIPADSTINNPMFKNNQLFLMILKAVKTNEITAYRDEEFQQILPYDSIKEYENIAVMLYRIKEDFFYNKTLNLTEYRTIGIGPAVKKTGKIKILFWLYYPAIRNWLAAQKLETMAPNTITNVENLFFNRYYHSVIYKVSNVYDREIKDYKKGKDIEKEAEMIEMTAIDLEFEWWYNNTCPCKK